MRGVGRDNFGLLIAYVLPGSVALWGIAYHVDAVRGWLHATPRDAPSVGGFLFATLAATGLGLVVSAVRWAVIDRTLAWLGVRPLRWDFELLADRLATYEFLVAQHYRYYQFYSNMLVALAFTYISRMFAARGRRMDELWLATGFLLVEAVLFAGSWDTLRKYYSRTGTLLVRKPRRRGREGRPSPTRANGA